MTISIVVLDKGFVSVGVLSNSEDRTGWHCLDNACVVRRWGTTAGLGQLAMEGPQPQTVLDKTPRQSFPEHSIVKVIDCDEDKWAKVLGVKKGKK